MKKIGCVVFVQMTQMAGINIFGKLRMKMAKFKKYEVEIGTNGHIKYKGKIIAILSAWCRYEDLDEDSLYNQIIKQRGRK